MIQSVSASDGYITGGQTVVIDGWGLKGTSMDDVEVEIDGVPCVVSSHTLDRITCISGAAADVSLANVSQPGSPGLTQNILDPTNED